MSRELCKKKERLFGIFIAWTSNTYIAVKNRILDQVLSLVIVVSLKHGLHSMRCW
jgi:hypothetical protein